MNSGYATALFISAAIAAVVSLMSWGRRHSPGASGLAVASAAMCFWALTYALMWLSSGQALMRFWLDMTYVGVVTVPPAMLLFALEHTKKARYITQRNVIALFTIPLMTLVILWTDPIHHLFYGGVEVSSQIFSGGPWFWVNAVYGYALLLLVLALLSYGFFRSPALCRKQAGAILAAISLPFLTNLFSLLGLQVLPGLDLTPITFTVTGAIIALALFSFGMLEIVPVARGKLVDSMADGVIVLDSKGRMVDLNPAAERFVHVDKSTIGTDARFALPAWCMRPDELTGREWSHEEVIAPTTGRTIEVRWTPLARDGVWSGDLITLRDITERAQVASALQKYREELERLAITDELTGLPNRRKAIEVLETEFSRYARTQSTFSVAMLDIDDFKSINDSFGHAAGDEVLAEVAARLSSVVRDYDLVARIGGEEFLVIAPETDREGAFVLAERLRSSVAQTPFAAADQMLSVTVSAGVSTALDTDGNIDPLLARADQALYDAKRRGRNRVVIQ